MCLMEAYPENREVKKMKLAPLKLGNHGQASAVSVQLTLIITLIVAIIIVYQLGIAGVAPTDNTSDPDYDKSARDAYDRTVTMAWAGIGLMALAIIVLAASVILAIVRGTGGARV